MCKIYAGKNKKLYKKCKKAALKIETQTIQACLL